MSALKDKINCLIWHKAPWLAYKLHSVGNNTVVANSEFMEVYLQILREGEIFLSLRDMFNIYHYVCRCRTLNGDMAEVGVFQGKGAKLISSFKGESTLHLFDTFGGMPETNKSMDSFHNTGDFSATSLELVQTYLKAFPNIRYYKGYFPDSTKGTDLPSKKFSFVHLDADIFQTTLDGLRFFYPRMEEGGVIISHDYSSQTCSGVKEAFDIFCSEMGTVPIPLWDTQCMIVKPQRVKALNGTTATASQSLTSTTH